MIDRFVTFILLAAILLFAFGLMNIGVENTEEYNKQACAVTGYQPDCKTPLED